LRRDRKRARLPGRRFLRTHADPVTSKRAPSLGHHHVTIWRLASLRELPVLWTAWALAACAPTTRTFPLREPIWTDSDLASVTIPCRSQPTRLDPRHVSCAPQVVEVPQIWTALDHVVFYPLSDTLGITAHGEAENVNSLDEVPDSSWFTNRPRPSGLRGTELPLATCDASLLLDPDHSPDGSWIVDHGKASGATSGFRVNIPGKGKYMFEADGLAQPELPTAASIVGAAIYHAAGFNTPCEQIVYFRPSLLKLMPGLKWRHNNIEDERSFDERALQLVLASCARHGPLVRMHASGWIPGHLLGPFRYDGTRPDDPNDVIPHENRRELRGARLLAAWTDHWDARDANSMDAWLADPGNAPDGSPGHVVHYYLDTSDALGPEYGQRQVTMRLGYSYIIDWGDTAADLLTLGIPKRPWDRPLGDAGYEVFRNFDVHSFAPDEWKMQYPNPAFSRMTERDGAWMARILARFTPESVRALAKMAWFSDPSNTDHLGRVLEGRLERILDRYLTRLSPIGELRVEGASRLCGVDLAEARAVRDPTRFRYAARLWKAALPVEVRGGGEICVLLPHVAPDAGLPDGSPARYVRVSVDDGVAQAPLFAYLYDLGPTRGYVLAGLERPEP
jgi:hypothetical protein